MTKENEFLSSKECVLSITLTEDGDEVAHINMSLAKPVTEESLKDLFARSASAFAVALRMKPERWTTGFLRRED